MSMAFGWLLISLSLIVFLFWLMHHLTGQARRDREARQAREHYEALVSAAMLDPSPSQEALDARVCAELERSEW